MTKERILIVDDNAANTKLTSFILASEGYDVHTAIDAAQALEEIASSPPHLILMDIQLPGMDGLTLTRKLRADSATAHVIIIAVTAYAMKGDEEKALAAGCDGYITKPIDTRKLGASVASYLAARSPA
jgi:CheY-like chemotaxis protein